MEDILKNIDNNEFSAKTKEITIFLVILEVLHKFQNN